MRRSLTNVTTASTTRITAAPTVQPISRRVLPRIWAGDGALARPELEQRVEQRALDAEEDDDRDGHHEPVERVDLVRVRRARRDSGANRPAEAPEAKREQGAAAASARRGEQARTAGRRERPAQDAADSIHSAADRDGTVARAHAPPKDAPALLEERRRRPPRSRRDSAISCWMPASNSSWLVHPLVEPAVELALGPGVGPRRAGRRGARAARSTSAAKSSSGTTRLIRPQLERLLGAGTRSPSIAISRRAGEADAAAGRAATSRRRAPGRCSRRPAGSRRTPRR